MGNLYLVRHGQASFGAEDYDQLSEQGQRQSVRLGEYFAHKGIVFEAALRGTLRRHAQTYDGICTGYAAELSRKSGSMEPPRIPDAAPWPGLNEYDADAVITAVHPEPLKKPDSPEMYRMHFRLLREGLAAWMAGTASPAGMPSFADFRAGIVGALDHVKNTHSGNVLMVSSGGPIATAVSYVLGAAADVTIDLNLRIRNSAVTEFVFTPKRHMLLTYNTIPHLDHPDHASWITFA